MGNKMTTGVLESRQKMSQVFNCNVQFTKKSDGIFIPSDKTATLPESGTNVPLKKERQNPKLSAAGRPADLKKEPFLGKQTRDSLATPKGIETFILTMPGPEINIDDVLAGFWDDWDELAKRTEGLQTSVEAKISLRRSLHKSQRDLFYQREEVPAKKELRKLRDIPKTRTAKVMLAFNQLFLAGKVKMKLYPRPEFGEDYNTPRTFAEYKAWRIMRCGDDIKRMTELVNNGEGGAFAKCWLGNLYDYLESYKGTEVLERRKLDASLQRVIESKGSLVCFGGLYEDTWPDVIIKVDGVNYILQGRLF